MNHLRFEFSATYCNAWPKLRFYIDGDLYHDYHFEKEVGIVTLPVDLLDGSHQIEIELYDKTDHDTIVENDKIIKDQTVTLNTMYLDDVLLPELFLYRGRYEHSPNNIALTWGIPGKWSFNFDTPIVTWALQIKHMNQVDADTTMVSTFSFQKNKKLLNLLDLLEQELLDV